MGIRRSGRRTAGRPPLEMSPPTAAWYRRDGGDILCLLCPHACRLEPGEFGICGVRKNIDGEMELPGWSYLAAEALDPIEKKPLYHVRPGGAVWSVGFAGCSLDCPFCQNHRIAKAPAGIGRSVSPETTVRRAREAGAEMVAYTYSEPTVHFEYLLETASIAREKGLLNILVTNGHLNRKPATELLAVMDAANVDLKAWDPVYYREVLGGRLDAVKAFIETAAASIWLEVTTLIVPGDNDDTATVEGISGFLGALSENIPLHLSAYHPARSYQRPSTDPNLLTRAMETAGKNLRFVYPGNLGSEVDTYCPSCHRAVIRRRGYRVEATEIRDGQCTGCGAKIPGLF